MNTLRLLVIAAATIALLSNPAFSESRIRVSLSGTLALQQLGEPRASGTNLVVPVSPLTLTASLGSRERMVMTLSLERFIAGTSESGLERLLQGDATFSSRRHRPRSPVGAVLARRKEGLELRIMVRPNGSRVFGKRYAMLTFTGILSSDNETRVTLRGTRRGSERACGTADADIERAPASIRNRSALETLDVKQIDIILEGDNEFFAATSRAVQEIAEMVNMTDAIYRRDLGLTLNPTIVPTASAYTSVFRYDENFILDIFTEMRQKRPSNSEDIFALMTGKTPPDQSLKDTAGIAAEIGSTCKDPSSSIVVVRRFDDLIAATVVTFAHEVGHLLNATHDDNRTGNIGYIMNSGTNSPSRYVDEFSTSSKTEIGDYLAVNGGCLGVGSDLPAPVPTVAQPGTTTITGYVTKVKRKKFAVFSVLTGDQGVPSFTVDIFRLNKRGVRTLVSTAVTDASGFISIARPPKGRYIAVSRVGSIESNVVIVRP